MATDSRVISFSQPNTALVDKDGKLSFPWLVWFRGLQSAQQTVVEAFTPSGVVIAPLSITSTIDGRGGTLGSILANLSDLGAMNTNALIDGIESPLAGGKAAYAALLASSPSAGEILEFDGTNWVPAAAPSSGVPSVDGITGAVTLVAGAGISITDNSPSPGNIMIASSGAVGYLTGTVTINFTATSGTFTATATITGAALNQAVFMGDPAASFDGGGVPLFQNKGAYVSGANTVNCSATISGFASPPGNVTFPVVVFP